MGKKKFRAILKDILDPVTFEFFFSEMSVDWVGEDSAALCKLHPVFMN